MRSSPIRLLLPLMGLGLLAPACQAPLEEDVELAPESPSIEIPGTTGDISAEADPYMAVYRFEGRFTPGVGFEFEPARLENDGLRTADQPLWCGVNVIQDGVPNVGPVDSFELVGNGAPAEGPDCFGGAYPTGSPLVLAIYQTRGAICQNITLRSFYDTESFNRMYAVIDLLTPATGYNGYLFPLGTGAEPPTDGGNFPNASRGIWSYGNLAPSNGVIGGPDESTTQWTLENAGEAFTFSGRVVAAIAETCNNNVDDDCDGSIDDGCQQFALGAACTTNLDCASVNCDSVSSRCAATTCGDGIENGTETDLDCGGLCAANCTNGLGCLSDTDCVSGICFANTCEEYRRPLPNELIISEFMPNPTGDDTLREWIEITNPSATTFSLQGCVLTDVGATESYTIPVEVLSPAGNRILIGRSSDTAQNGGLNMAHANTAAFNLGNSGDSIVLRCGGQVVDQVSYASTQVREKYSIQLSSSAMTTAGNDNAANLCAGVAAVGNGDFGTPGAANVTCALSNISCVHNSPLGTFGAVASDVIPATVAIRVPGITDLTAGANPSPLIQVQMGVAPTVMDITTLDDSNWVPATLQAGFSSAGALAGFDRYGASATMPSVAGSSLNLGFRVRGDTSAPWIYCDTGAGSADGFTQSLLPLINVQAAAPSPQPGDFLITELLVDSNQGGSPEPNEFVEFRNVSGATLDIQNCVFGDNQPGVGITSSVQIPPGGYVVLTTPTQTWTTPPGAYRINGASNFALVNSGADFAIMTCASGTITRLDFTSSGGVGTSRQLPPSRQNSSHLNSIASMCLTPGALPENRMNTSAPFDYGTPGRDNPECAALGAITECYVNVGSPTSLAVQTVNAVVGTPTTIGARVTLPGLTDASNGLNSDLSLVGQIGYGPADTDPSIDFNAYTWTAATGTGGSTVGEDQYDATVTAPAIGTYAIAARFSQDGGDTWTYCDTKEETPQEFSLALLDSFVTTAPPTLASCDVLYPLGTQVYAGDAVPQPSVVISVPGVTDLTPALDLSSLVTVSHAWSVGTTQPALGSLTFVNTTTPGTGAIATSDAYLAPAFTVPNTTVSPNFVTSVFRITLAGGAVHYCGGLTPGSVPYTSAAFGYWSVQPFTISSVTQNGGALSTVEGSRLSLSANLLVPNLTDRSSGSEESPLVTVEHSFVPTGNAASFSATGVTFDTTYAASNSDTRYTVSLLAPRTTGAYDSQFRACYNGGSCVTSGIRTITLTASPVWINEVNYAASGASEGVEIAGLVGTDLTGWTFVYRAASGAASSSDLALSGTLTSATSGVGLRFFSRSGMATAGHAVLVSPAGAVVDHISWGTLTGQPNGGLALGSTSTPTGVTANSPNTISRTGSGCSKAEFSGFASAAFTQAALNAGQTTTCAPPVLPPVDSCSATLSATNFIGSGVSANVTVTLAGVTDTLATADPALEIESQLIAATSLATEPTTGWSTAETFVAQVGADHTYTVSTTFPEALPVSYGYIVRARYSAGPWTYCYADGAAPGTYSAARVGTLTPTAYTVNSATQQTPSAATVTQGTAVTYSVLASVTNLTERSPLAETSSLVTVQHSIYPAAGSPTTWNNGTFDSAWAASNATTRYTISVPTGSLAAGSYLSVWRVCYNVSTCVNSATQALTVNAPVAIDPWINEVLYQQTGTAEGVEIAGPAGSSVGGLRISYYAASGNPGSPSLVTILAGTTLPAGTGITTLFIPYAGLSNTAGQVVLAGAAGNNTVFDHVSWGTVSTNPTTGIGLGSTRTATGATSSGATNSIGRTGTGCNRAAFGTWVQLSPQSPGAVNAGQTISGCP